MDVYNKEYIENIKTVHTADNTFDIEESIKNLSTLRNDIFEHNPEFIESIVDIDYGIACAAYRINNVELFEDIIKRHYYDDIRFKKLYQKFREVEMANVWNEVVQRNANKLEKTFVRSLSIVILTGLSLAIILRK